MKRFLDWIRVKARLDIRQFPTPIVHEGQIWWISIGENIGAEISGKDEKFFRPVLILTKFSNAFYFAIPLTTTPKKGSWFFRFKVRGKWQTGCLHQGRSIDYRRLQYYMGQVSESTLAEMRKATRSLYRL